MPVANVKSYWSSGNLIFTEKIIGNDAVVQFGVDGDGIDIIGYSATSGSYFKWDESADQLQIYTTPNAYNATSLSVYAVPIAPTVGIRNGIVNITCNRAIAWTNAWDGNADIALKVQIYNYSVSTVYGRIEGFEVLARNRTGSCSSIHGGYITAENYVGAGEVVNVTGLEVHSKVNGVCTGSVKILRVYDESQSGTGTTYGIELNCTGDSGFAREYGIFIGAGATSSWTNAISFNDTITNVFDFEDSDGTNGATLKSGSYTTGGNQVKIRIDVAGTPYYFIAHATAS